MKKIIIFSLIVLLLSSCSFGIKKGDIDKAKKELLEQSDNKSDIVDDDLFKKDTNVPALTKDKALTGAIKNIENNDEPKEPAKVSFKIEDITTDQFISIDDLSNSFKDINSGIEITGTTLASVDKIIVDFENKSSDFPIDSYRLGQFKAGDKNFVYRAKGEFKVLDFGDNEYIFNAYSGDKISKLKVLIHIPEKTKDTSHNNKDLTKSTQLNGKISYEKKIIGDGDDSVYLSFPKSDTFGDPLSVGTDLITYSKIDNLEIKRVDFGTGTVSCDNMTDYLKENIGGWFYWNTCRDIIKDKGISVFVLRLDGDKYVYEKKYFDFNHGLIGNYIVKDNIEADKENVANQIAEINSSLKETNKDTTVAYENYPELKVVDKLFYEIVR